MQSMEIIMISAKSAARMRDSVACFIKSSLSPWAYCCYGTPHALAVGASLIHCIINFSVLQVVFAILTKNFMALPTLRCNLLFAALTFARSWCIMIMEIVFMTG
jgi:hypothetical protein